MQNLSLKNQVYIASQKHQDTKVQRTILSAHVVKAKYFSNKYIKPIFVYIINNIKEKFMNKTILEKVKIVLGLIEEAEVKLSEAMLKDGSTMVEAEEFAVGMPLNIVNADGSYTPAPEGEHELADGTKLTVDANGVITEVVAPVEEEPAPEAAPVAQENQEELNDAVVETVSKEQFDALVEKIAKLEETLLLSAETFAKNSKEITEKVEKLAASPAAEPIKAKGVVPQEENALRGLLKNKK